MLPSPIKNVEVDAAPPIENSNADADFTTAILFGPDPYATSLSSLPSPTVIEPIGVVTLCGNLHRYDNGSIIFNGLWGMSFEDLVDARGMTNPFSYKLQSIETSQESPYSGKYTGHFLYDKNKVEILDTMEINSE
jgi:hypothetical protein